MLTLDHRLDRDVLIHASRDTVFAYFTDSARWSMWWGAGSTIDPRPGGAMYIRFPNGVEVRGEVIDVHAPERIAFTYGFVSGDPIPPGASRVTITLSPQGALTRLHLVHEFPEAAARDQHLQGWRYQLSVFSNVVADALHANAAGIVDTWFDAFAETDEQKRTAMLDRIANPEITLHDKFSAIAGLSELVAHVSGAQRFMPGVRLRRRGDVRHCQGMVLADWDMFVNEEKKGAGSNVFVFAPDGKLESVTGFWG